MTVYTWDEVKARMGVEIEEDDVKPDPAMVFLVGLLEFCHRAKDVSTADKMRALHYLESRLADGE